MLVYRSGKITLPSCEQYCRYVVDFLERQSPRTIVDRIISDPTIDCLIAPDWMKKRDYSKSRFYQDVVNEFQKRGSYQGKLFHNTQDEKA